MRRMKLIADSGSTKTDWALAVTVADGDQEEQVYRFSTQGINPVHQQADTVRRILNGELLPQLGAIPLPAAPMEVFFYGAGCAGEYVAKLTLLLSDVLAAVATDVSVHAASDLLAAARALCGSSEGIACILGTGANSCLYDGKEVVRNIPPLGYILGDEGSGAVLGRLFLNALYKEELPASLREDFLVSQKLTYSDIINKVYREPMANRWLASLTVFIGEHLQVEGVRQLVLDNFRHFLRKNVLKYGRCDLPVHAVGSVAWYFREELAEAVRAEGCTLGRVLQWPMEGLLEFHQ